MAARRLKLIAIIAVCLFGTTQTPISVASVENIFMPISTVTPGSTNPLVTQENIHSTICVSGFTTKIRPSSSYTTDLKVKQLSSTYSRYGDKNTKNFEEDHLIPLELGGSPKDPKNLWPEPWSGESSAKVKDRLENALHALVCSDSLQLEVAQKAIATNWYLAFQQYVIKITPTNSPMPTSSTPSVAPIASAAPTPSPSKTPVEVNSSKIISPGAFCSPVGAIGKSKSGLIYTCTSSPTDTKNRWRQK